MSDNDSFQIHLCTVYKNKLAIKIHSKQSFDDNQ